MAYLTCAEVTASDRCRQGLGIVPAIVGAITAIAPVAASAIDKFGGNKSKGNDQSAALLMQLQQQQAAQAAAQAQQQRILIAVALGVAVVGLMLLVGRDRETQS